MVGMVIWAIAGIALLVTLAMLADMAIANWPIVLVVLGVLIALVVLKRHMKNRSNRV